MSPQEMHPDTHPSQAADPMVSLDQELQAIWQNELSHYSQTLQQQYTLPSVPRSPRPSRSRKKRATPRKSLSAVRQPGRVTRSPRFRLNLIPSRIQLRAAAVLTVVGTLGLASYQFWLGAQPVDPPPIQQMMYQNAESKVAAFRKELDEGQYVLSDDVQPVLYESKPGDTIEKISKKYHVSPNTILKNNDRKKIDDILEPGTQLTILPVDGIAHPVERHDTLAELSKRYEVGIQEIIEVNQLDNPHMITEKQKIIIPNATELKHRPKPVFKAVAAATTGKDAPVTTSKTGRRLSWPSQGVVTSNYGWRWLRMHNGMDVAGPIGTPIKAAKEGRVVYSGWMGGYGYAIDLDHGNGVRTRYAHCSSLKVRTGEYVGRGQVIAAMGSTGHSTGSHLHFEVHVNGQPIDPRAYF